MKTRSASLLAFCLLLAGLTAAYLSCIADVPFHPDESTQLFTSGDVELFWEDPSKLFWRADREGDRRQLYRLLDAPLTRYLIGLGRQAAGEPPLAVDWDWGQTWEENQQAGALPATRLLLVARWSVAFLYPFSVLLLFLAARRLANDFTAWTAALLLASNALVLLHTRRAMAESVLLFTTVLALWSLLRAEKRPWLVSIPAALAFCAKQSLAALAPVGFAAALWSAGPATHPGQMAVRRALLFGLVFAAILFLLNPFLWQQPFQAIQAAVEARQELASLQAGDRPSQALDTPGRKLISLVGALYLTPPILYEVGNYAEETRAAEQAYLANPLHTLFRSLAAGGILLILNLFGFLMGWVRAARAAPLQQRRLVLALAATLLQGTVLLILVPLPWQRYYLPLAPFVCLWTAYGIDQLRHAVRLPRTAKAPAEPAG